MTPLVRTLFVAWQDPESRRIFPVARLMRRRSGEYELRYIGKMALDSAENYLTVQDRAPQNADFADRLRYPSVIYHDIRAGYDFTAGLNAYVGVDNVTNKLPPLGLIGSTSATSPTTAQSSIYNIRGRFFFAGARYKF